MVNDIRPNGKRPLKHVAKRTASKKVPVKKEEVEPVEPTFIPPEAVHDNDAPAAEALSEDRGSTKSTPAFGKKASKTETTKPNKIHVFIGQLKDKWASLSKRGKIITACVAVGLLGGLVAASIMFWPHKKVVVVPPPVVEKKAEVPKPTTEASTLSGLQVPFDVNKRPVIGVMIENSPDARPQSGLLEASIVYEAVAEGGITRFLALFQDTRPGYIGPVRSARLYYVSWMLGYDAAYAHAGGSPTGIAKIHDAGVKDMDQFYNSGAYDRVSSRYAPHNLYSGVERLMNLANSKGWGTSTFTGFVRKPEQKAETPSASSIDIAISSSLYNVHYAYDTGTNSYLRSEGGQAHTDEKSGKQLNPKVVIALITDKGFESDGLHSTYRTIGTGAIMVFQDGTMTQGTWSKSDDKAPLVLKDAAGQDLKLNPGQTWITAVGNASSVTFAP